MKVLTTLKLTSASSSAIRTSRRASWIFSSVSRPVAPEAVEDLGQTSREAIEHGGCPRTLEVNFG